MDETDTYNPMESKVPDLLDMADTAVRTPKPESVDELPFTPVCDPVPDKVLASLLFYAPIALNFIYAEREVDMQLLAAQQGWRLLYAHLDQESRTEGPSCRSTCIGALSSQGTKDCLLCSSGYGHY